MRSQPWFGGLEFRSPSLRVRLMFPVFLLPWCVVQAFGPLKTNRVGFHLMSFCILLTMRLITAQFCSHGCRAQVQQTPGKIISFSAFSGNLGKWPWPFLLVCKLSIIKCIWGISKQPGLPNAFVICLPKMEEAISERPCLDFICFQPTCAVLMRTAAGTIGSLCVQCTVLGASFKLISHERLHLDVIQSFLVPVHFPPGRSFFSWSPCGTRAS